MLSQSILINQTIQEKKSNNEFEDTELPAGESYSMWNILDWVLKRSGIYKGDQRESHII